MAGRAHRGAALIIALVLVLVLTMIIVGTQFLVVHQLKVSRSERNYERALQMAEAGANAYINELGNGFIHTSGGAYDFMPPRNSVENSFVVDLKTFRQRAASGNTSFPITHYPSGQTGQGFCVGAIQNGSSIKIISYGFCNGAVRMVQVSGTGLGVFDWLAVYGLNPYSNSNKGPNNDSGPALQLKNVDVFGPSGSEGGIGTTGSTHLNGGPIVLSANGSTLNPSFNPNSNSGPAPRIDRLPRSLGFPTADESANQWAQTRFNTTTSAGVQYFRSNHNDNSTGLRYLVQVTKKNAAHFGQIRELNDPAKPYNIVPNSAYMKLDTSSPTTAALGALGMDTTNESFYGIRAYPGNYYFDEMDDGSPLFIRSYADGSGPGSLTVYSYNWATTNPSNPNSGMASEANIRFWIGDATPAQSKQSKLTSMTMEDTTYASRFRIYDANKGGISLKQTTIQASILVYNYDPVNHYYYGYISVETLTDVLGSLIGWQVETHGNNTLTKPTTFDAGNTDGILFSALSWREIQ